MYPTLFRINFLPEAWADIKSYGVMIMIGFLGGIWLACRRALRVKADPDVVLNMGFIALIAGVVGSRAMFVMHYWSTRFANQSSPIAAILDIRAGGLEFWGGPLLVVPCLIVYLWRSRNSIRWYLDITAPALMFGMAMARIGCFLNGCCWGSVCLNEHDPSHQQKGLPWAVRYPYGSPAMLQQFEFGQIQLPKELLCFLPAGQPFPIPRDQVEASREALDGPARDLRLAEDELRDARRLGLPSDPVEKLQTKVTRLKEDVDRNRQRYTMLNENCERYGLLPSELRDLARHYNSLPSHPAQLYASVTGLILYGLLATLFYRRRRHGVVFGWMLVFYSIARIFEEAIRQDNPLDVAGLTISQGISLATLGAGLVWLAYNARLPLKSPFARKFEMPSADETGVQPASAG